MDVPLALASLPAIPPEAAWQQYVNGKDAHVVAASLEIEAPYLLTLDQGLIVQVTNASLPIQALTPGDFIRGVLPHHLDYPNLRA
jgi:predicted nucleic acid-binding protein